MVARKGVSNSLAADVFSSQCPSRGVLDHVSSRWGVLVLVGLCDGELRFGELRRRVQGISEKMLSQTLSALERDGLVKRTAHPVIPPRVDYALTDLGAGLSQRVQELVGFIESNLGDVLKAQRTYDRRHC